MRAIFPMATLNVTRGYGVASHKGTLAIDNAGKDSKIDDFFAPFDGVVRRIYANGNTVWLESTGDVICPDGHVGRLVVMTVHDNSVKDLKVGQVIKQGEVYYQEGTAGIASGNHVHIEVGRGPFTGTGWHRNSNGIWTINNPVRLEDAFYLHNTTVINDGGYAWKEVNMINDDNIWLLRLVNAEAKGYDRDAVYNGETDANELKAWKGKTFEDFLRDAAGSKATAKFGDLKQKMREAYVENEELKKRIAELESASQPSESEAIDKLNQIKDIVGVK